MLYHFAFYTLIFQALVFPLLLLWTIYFVAVNLFKPSVRKSREDKKGKEKNLESFSGPAIDAIECNSCHAPLPLSSSLHECEQCGTPFSLPEEWKEIVSRREAAARRLNEAIRYWKKAEWMTSRWVRSALLLLILWLVATPVIILIESNRKADFDAWIDQWGSIGSAVIGISFFTLIFWILILFITRGIISPKRRALLPELDFKKSDAMQDVKSPCEHCNAELTIQKGSFSSVCNYCGTENFRKSFAWKMVGETKKHQQAVSKSLLQAMDAYRSAMEDAVQTPAILVFILIILPFFVIVVPMYLFDLIGEHPWITAGIVFCGITLWFIRDTYFSKAKN
ncbi:MAG: hypothetical protein K1X56_10545 [Flavobacteriales bacterium]|nr:hypothetical protein [Flavobacteriales bacterium]